MKKVERIKDLETWGFYKKGCSGCSWNKCGLKVHSLEMMANPCCDSGMERARRPLGMRESWWGWITRINIIIRQINRRLWARKECGRPGARVFKDRHVNRMSADLNNEEMESMMAWASKRDVARWKLAWGARRMPISLEHEVHGMVRKYSTLKTWCLQRQTWIQWR